MKTIYLVRHGENPANLTKEFSYRHVDYSLTPKGVEQARQTARYFAGLAEAGQPIDHVFASPLKRAFETAQVIATQFDLQVIREDALREVNVGTLEVEGDLRENWRLHNEIVEGWRSGQPGTRFPGGEDLHGLHTRVRAAMERILARTQRASVVVSHGGIVAFGVSAIADPLGADLGAEHPNCSISRLTFTDGIPGRVDGWAQWDHLSGPAAEIISGILEPGSI
jgi:broad specificity phosphatase PhoE